MLAINDLLKGRYRIEAYIHSGGMGAVYKAYDQLHRRLVAVKENTWITHTLLREQFQREAALLARLGVHEVLPQVFDYFTEDVRQFLVMQYIEGEDLEKRLQRLRGPLELAQVLEWTDKVLGALNYLHTFEPQVIHRDIKPANLKLTPDGKIFLLDFGLAKNATTPTLPGGSFPGFTRDYSPPEQRKGTGTDERSDIYALGATLYHLLTDKPPYESPLRETLIQRGLSDPQPAVDEANPQVPRAIAEVIRRAMSVDPADRYGSAVEMREALSRAQTPQLFPDEQTFEFITVKVNEQGQEVERRTGQARCSTSDLGGGVTLEMVEISGGTFTMGSPDAEKERYGGEGPQHQVTVRPFLIGKYQLTQAQWRAVAGLPKVDRDLNADPSNFRGDDLPVEQVSWEEAVEFCARLSLKTGETYRLPSEAEWEYACRGGTVTPFAFGETITPQIVNYNGNYPYGSAPKGIYREKTIPVGSLGVANGFGLYDMHGNVWEWCQDVYHENYNGAPADGSAWMSGGNQGLRVLRGGSWNYDGCGCRAAYRDRSAPGVRGFKFGFRVVVSSRTP